MAQNRVTLYRVAFLLIALSVGFYVGLMYISKQRSTSTSESESSIRYFTKFSLLEQVSTRDSHPPKQETKPKDILKADNEHDPGNKPQQTDPKETLEPAPRQDVLIPSVLPTRFLYLTQTESCLPAYLRSPKVIGDPKACQCDVLVLSFKTKCTDTYLPHVEYITTSFKSTWTTGRNALVASARKRNETYIYYLYMDDDVQLFMFDKKSKENPWRIFEESLKIYQPAVIIVLSDYHSNIFPKETLPERDDCEVTRYQQIYRMDALFNGFHYQTVDHLHPYTAKYDSTSVWFSNMYATIRFNLQYNGLVVFDPRIRTQNLKHRPYPRKSHTDTTIKNIVSDIRPEIPEKYRKKTEPILQQWETDRDSKWLLGRRLCKRDVIAYPYIPYDNL